MGLEETLTSRRYDEAIERDLAALHLAGTST